MPYLLKFKDVNLLPVIHYFIKVLFPKIQSIGFTDVDNLNNQLFNQLFWQCKIQILHHKLRLSLHLVMKKNTLKTDKINEKHGEHYAK